MTTARAEVNAAGVSENRVGRNWRRNSLKSPDSCAEMAGPSGALAGAFPNCDYEASGPRRPLIS